MPLVFPITGRPAKIVGRTPRSAAGPLAGLPVVDETDPLGEGGSREVTFCSGICSSGGFAQGGPARTGGFRPTIFAEFSELEKRAALGCQPASCSPKDPLLQNEPNCKLK